MAMKPGDGVVFENIHDTNDEQGGRVYEVSGSCLAFQHGRLDWSALPIGTGLYKTDDPALNKQLRHSFENDIPLRKQSVLNLTLTGEVGQLLYIECNGIKIPSIMPLQLAQKRPLTLETAREQMSRLGGTAYELGEITFLVKGESMLPISELNRMRRSLLEALDAKVPAPQAEHVTRRMTVEEMLAPVSAQRVSRSSIPHPQSSTLHVLCRTLAHVDAALTLGIPRLYIDFEDIRLYGDVVKRVRDHGERSVADAPHSEVYLATPRIQKSGETGFFKLIERASPDGVLIRNLGALAFFKDSAVRVTGDFSLNISNPLTADFLKHNTALEQLTISYDLNLEQVLDLLRASPPEWFELTLHQHMPMFHMEHCVFAAFMSEGKDFNSCGRPCEKHSVKLRDRVGMEHPLKADVGCRNTLFNAVAQTGARFIDDLREAGLRHYRVELLEESRDEATQVLRTYQQLLSGARGGDEVWRELKAQSQLGVTRGTMAELVRE
jgi:U32 family peptidase